MEKIECLALCAAPVRKSICVHWVDRNFAIHRKIFETMPEVKQIIPPAGMVVSIDDAGRMTITSK